MHKDILFSFAEEAKRTVLFARFLRNVGWGTEQGIGGFGEEPGIKAQLMNLIRSVRTVMRVPLIAVNSITVVLLLLFG
uniref:Immediate early response 3-interacting protein 1 n=1 Tax=Chelydra serpentina TaxID=8475 RepID=A0A8C3STH8_CHESE